MKQILFHILLIAGVMSAFALGAEISPAGGDATQPSAVPATEPAAGATTRPVGFALGGQVSIHANLDFANPNLSRVVIYLDSDPVLDAEPLPAGRATMAQKNKAFSPNFLVIPRNTEVEFPNWDHFFHNVFSRSAAAPAFDLDRYGYGMSKMRKFDKVGVVQLFCNVHPSMKALIFVTPNQHFTRSDAAGHFEMTGIPQGHWNVTAWQERCQPAHLAVDVGPGLSPQIVFTLDEDRNNILANDPPRHPQPYGVDRGLGRKQEKLNLPVVGDVHPAPTTEPCPDCK